MSKHVLIVMAMVMGAVSANCQKISFEQKKEYMANQGGGVHFVNQNKTGDLSRPQTHDEITLAMVNCPEGVYRTYEDFINQKPADLKVVSWDIDGGSFEGLKDFEVVVKDKDGGKDRMNCKDFWGWKDGEGMLWRNGMYTNEGHTFYIPFYVEYVSDYVEYHPFRPNCELRPFEWVSGDLKSPILEATYYFSKFKTRHDKVVLCQNECDKNTPKAFSKYFKLVEECEMKCPDIKFVYYRGEKGEQGKFAKGGM